MSEEDPSPDAGEHTPDPNTGRELAKARADAKRYREEAQRLREDFDAEKKVADGLRGQLVKQQKDAAAKLAERDEREAALIAEHEREVGERAAREETLKATHEQAIAAIRKQEADAKSAYETELAGSHKERDEMKVTYEIRNAAIKAGVIDENDFVKLVDRSGLKLDKEGKITGIAELIEQSKTEKAYMFVKPAEPVVLTTSSNTRKAPDPDTKPKLATEMSPEDYKIARAAIASGLPFN